jgi:hypothetical protein
VLSPVGDPLLAWQPSKAKQLVREIISATLIIDPDTLLVPAISLVHLEKGLHKSWRKVSVSEKWLHIKRRIFASPFSSLSITNPTRLLPTQPCQKIQRQTVLIGSQLRSIMCYYGWSRHLIPFSDSVSPRREQSFHSYEAYTSSYTFALCLTYT